LIYILRMHAGDADALDAETVAATLEAPNSDSELASSDSEADNAYGSDEEAAAAAAYDAKVEQQLDNAYESYLQRRHARDAIKAEKHKRSRLRDAGAVVNVSNIACSVQ
jgi:nitroreductase